MSTSEGNGPSKAILALARSEESKAPPVLSSAHAREDITPAKQMCGPLNVNNLPRKRRSCRKAICAGTR